LSEKDPFYTLEKDIQYLKYKNDTVTLIKNKIKKELSIKIKKKFSIIEYYKNEIAFIKKHIEAKNIDTIVLSQGALSSITPVLKSSHPNLKVIVWQHSEATVYFKSYNRLFLEEYIRGIQSADCIVCLTNKDYEVFHQYYENCKQIYNPVNLENIHVTNLNNLNICFAGRIMVESKGLDIIIKSMKYIDNNVHLYIAGNSNKKELRKLNKLIAHQNLTNRIKLFGALKNDEMAKFYSKADIYISASQWEGFGLTVVEAMKCGLPVIAFDNSGPKEILSDGKYGIVLEERTPKNLANSINNLLNNLEELNNYQKLSMVRAEDFSIEKIGKEWIKILN
jgi:glycosyltransferase involved in cell wall biosynthesis